MEQGEIILYQPDETVKLEVRMENETVWLTQAQMVDLFQRDQSVIARHINNIFKEAELEKESNMHFLHNAFSDKPSELPTPKGMSFGENSPLFFPASFCHCFLGHEVVHPQEGSPQA